MVNQMIPIEEYFLPQNVEEALLLLRKGKKDYFILSGGTSLAFAKPKGIKAIVDLSRIGLQYVKRQKNGILMGAATPVCELINNPVFSDYYGGMVREAALTLATTPLRNLITLGGNVLQIYPWSTLPPLFLALGAKFKTTGEGKDPVPAEEFFFRHPSKQLEKAELLREIILPRQEQGARGAFLKFSKTETDFALLNIAALLRVKNGKCLEARIAVGAVASLPIRLLKAEEALMGSSLTKEILKSAAQIGGESLKPMKDFRVKDGYKERIAPILIERCLSLAWKRFGRSNT